MRMCARMCMCMLYVLAWPRRYAETSTESSGAMPAASVALGSPASARNVAYRSAMWMEPPSVEPRTARGISPPDAKAKGCTPPSQFDALPPRRGSLLPAAPQPQIGLPLSPAISQMVVSHMPAALRADVTFSTVSSTIETMPLQTLRSRCAWVYRASYTAGTWNGACVLCSER